MTGSLRKTRASEKRAGWYRLKYLILIFLLASSAFGMQLVGIFDPLSLLIRSLSVSINPLFNHGLTAFFDGIYRLNAKPLSAVSEPMYMMMKKFLLSFHQPYFIQGTFIVSSSCSSWV